MSTKLTKAQLFNRLQAHLKDFTMFEELPEKVQKSREEVVELVKVKGYHLIKEDDKYEYWVKLYDPGDFTRNKNPKSYLDAKNADYSVVILTAAMGSEGLVSTKKQTGFAEGLYCNGGVSTFTELYEIINRR